jgi:hypothetical protein
MGNVRSVYQRQVFAVGMSTIAILLEKCAVSSVVAAIGDLGNFKITLRYCGEQLIIWKLRESRWHGVRTRG